MRWGGGWHTHAASSSNPTTATYYLPPTDPPDRPARPDRPDPAPAPDLVREQKHLHHAAHPRGARLEAHEHARGIQQGDAPGTPHASPSAGAKSAARLLRCAEEDAAAQLAAARGGALGCGGEVTHGGGDAAAAALLEQSAAPLVLPLPPLASPPPSRPRADASTLILQDWQQKQDNVFVGRVWGFPGALPGELVQLVARVDGARAPEAGMLLYSGLQKQPVMLGLPR